MATGAGAGEEHGSLGQTFLFDRPLGAGSMSAFKFCSCVLAFSGTKPGITFWEHCERVMKTGQRLWGLIDAQRKRHKGRRRYCMPILLLLRYALRGELQAAADACNAMPGRLRPEPSRRSGLAWMTQ